MRNRIAAQAAPDTSYFPGNRHATSLGTNDPRHGGFQEYTTLPAALVAPIPKRMTFAEAAVLPLAINTAAAGLFQKDFLALPLPTASAAPSPSFALGAGASLLIWGGSSSVGACAIQLARAAGLDVVATASARNHALCRSLGARAVVDHAAADAVQQLVRALQGRRVAGAFDAISEAATLRASAAVLRQVGSGGSGSRDGMFIAATQHGAEAHSGDGVTIKPGKPASQPPFHPLFPCLQAIIPRSPLLR